MKPKLHQIKIKNLVNETQEEELGQAQYLRDQASQLYQQGGPGHEGKAIHLIIRATKIEDRYKSAWQWNPPPVPAIPFRAKREDRAKTDPAIAERAPLKPMPAQMSFNL